MLRHFSQPHIMTYISSHMEVFCNKVLLKVSQNLQENICAGAFFPATLIKNRLWHMWFTLNFLTFSRILFFTEHLWRLFLDLYSREGIFTSKMMVYFSLVDVKTWTIQMSVLQRYKPKEIREKLVWRQNTKSKCVQMFPKKVYICFVYI